MDKTVHRRRELLESTRGIGVDYRAHMILFKRSLNLVYPPDRADLAMQRSVALRTAIMSFLPDEIALKLLEKNKQAIENCEPLSDDRLEALAFSTESNFRIKPLWPLKFGRVIGSGAACHQIQLNSIESETSRSPYVNPYANPYQYLLPTSENNEAEAMARQAAAQQALIYQQAAAAQLLPAGRPAVQNNGMQDPAAALLPPVPELRAQQEQIAELQQARARELAAMQQQFSRPAETAMPAPQGASGAVPRSQPSQQGRSGQSADLAEMRLSISESVSEVVGEIPESQLNSGDKVFRRDGEMYTHVTVSYTHLTLPTTPYV